MGGVVVTAKRCTLSPDTVEDTVLIAQNAKNRKVKCSIKYMTAMMSESL